MVVIVLCSFIVSIVCLKLTCSATSDCARLHLLQKTVKNKLSEIQHYIIGV